MITLDKLLFQKKSLFTDHHDYELFIQSNKFDQNSSTCDIYTIIPRSLSFDR